MAKLSAKTPQRTCVACGRKAPQGQLVRLALSAGRVVIDPPRRLPGRGAYLCPGQKCLEILARQKNRDRIFKTILDENAWSDLFGDQACSLQG